MLATGKVFPAHHMNVVALTYWRFMMLKKLCAKALGLCLLLGCAPFLHGQSTYGSIQGVASDASGAAIPGAKVTLTSKSTGEN